MGIYLNPGNGMFQKAIDSEVYVDKTGLIAKTNAIIGTRDCMVCVSRPRRFGKSMAIDMLAAYYSRACDSAAQFAGFEIAGDSSFEKHLNSYDVIRLVMSDMFRRGGGTVDGALSLVEELVKEELAEAYPHVRFNEATPLVICLERTFKATGVPFVMLIDEWDFAMRESAGEEGQQKVYLDWLRDLLKDEEYVGLAYATGILPVKKYGQHSALNMFDEVSMLNAVPFSRFTGFTEDEVIELCVRYEMDFDETRLWYDGYDVDGKATFNPRSVVAAMTKRTFDSYWTQTETFEALKRYIMLDMGGLREKVAQLVGGAEVPTNIAKFQNDMYTFHSADDVLTLLVHLGYLTYNRAAGAVRIPNTEVAQEFVSCMEDDGWESVAMAIAESESLVAATLSGDASRVASLVERAHRDNASLLNYNDENALACVLSIAYYAARRSWRIEREVPAGKGYADLVFWPRPGSAVPAVVVDLKAGASAQDAIAQIRDRDYASALADYPGTLIVGISYDPDSKSVDYKEHGCVIERL